MAAARSPTADATRNATFPSLPRRTAVPFACGNIAILSRLTKLSAKSAGKPPLAKSWRNTIVHGRSPRRLIPSYCRRYNSPRTFFRRDQLAATQHGMRGGGTIKSVSDDEALVVAPD